jgi:hypothetical protein
MSLPEGQHSERGVVGRVAPWAERPYTKNHEFVSVGAGEGCVQHGSVALRGFIMGLDKPMINQTHDKPILTAIKIV